MVREEETVSKQGTVPISSRIDSNCSRIGWSRCWGACQIQFGMAIDLIDPIPKRHSSLLNILFQSYQQGQTMTSKDNKWRNRKNKAIKPSNPLLMSTPCGKFTQLELNHYNPWSGHLKSSNLDLWFQTKVSIWFQLNRISLTRLTLTPKPFAGKLDLQMLVMTTLPDSSSLLRHWSQIGIKTMQCDHLNGVDTLVKRGIWVSLLRMP